MASSPSLVKAIVADGVTTFLWVFCASSLGALTTVISSSLGLHHHLAANITITTSLVALLVTLFDALALLLRGYGSFNPTAAIAFRAAGVSNDDFVSLALRLPAQSLGAVGGALAILEYSPAQYRHMIGGPFLKVDPHTGAMAEGALTFLITFAVLWIMVRGPSNPLIRTWLLAVCTVGVVLAGSEYTGPSLNPVNAFGWAYVDKRHNTWEQFYVYWICPFVGAILAAWVFRLLSPSPAKVKKA